MPDTSKVLTIVGAAFSACEKPLQFCNPTHCEECAEHNALLCARDRNTLAYADVSNPGWDPICFASPEGVAYYFPVLAKLALMSRSEDHEEYASQLLQRLYSGYNHNTFFQFCSHEQKVAVSTFLSHLIETFPGPGSFVNEEELIRAHHLWSES